MNRLASRQRRCAAALVLFMALLSTGGAGQALAAAEREWPGVWAREEGLEHPDPTRILPFLNAAAAADFTRAIAQHNFRVPWSFCDPPGLPAILTEYPNGLEFLFTPGRVTMLAEDSSTRRIYTDGRPHPKEVDPTYYGDSIGHWEGATLVVDTVGLQDDNDIVIGYPADSETMHVQERWHKLSPELLQVDITVDGVEALKMPFTRTQRYKRRASGLMKEQLCVASKNRDTGSGLNLAPPPPQKRSQ
ncbi:MAG: hypothetical protein ABSE43_10765 [Steroidobacteraceae bacterium]|jgi:hypothetical protein